MKRIKDLLGKGKGSRADSSDDDDDLLSGKLLDELMGTEIGEEVGEEGDQFDLDSLFGELGTSLDEDLGGPVPKPEKMPKPSKAPPPSRPSPGPPRPPTTPPAKTREPAVTETRSPRSSTEERAAKPPPGPVAETAAAPVPERLRRKSGMPHLVSEPRVTRTMERSKPIEKPKPATPVTATSGPTPDQQELEGKVASLHGTVMNLESSMEDIGQEMRSMQERQETTENRIQELFGKYELLSNQFGQFKSATETDREQMAKRQAEMAADAVEMPAKRVEPSFHETNQPTESARPIATAPTALQAPPTPPAPHIPPVPSAPPVAPAPPARFPEASPPATTRAMYPEHGPYERCTLESGRPHRGPLLEHISNDYATVVLVMRWIEFLFERVKRNRISDLLKYYEDIDWISPEVKSNVMAYARGEVQDVTAYEPDLDDSMASFALDDDSPVLDDKGTSAHPHYRHMDDWKLPVEDHLKSLLFIKKIAGCRIDKDELNSLEQEIKVMKYSLRRYHQV